MIGDVDCGPELSQVETMIVTKSLQSQTLIVNQRQRVQENALKGKVKSHVQSKFEMLSPLPRS